MQKKSHVFVKDLKPDEGRYKLGILYMVLNVLVSFLFFVPG